MDALVGGAVEQPPLSTPPSSPAVGACYIVGAIPTGAWAGQAQSVAAWTNGGWRFLAPTDGLSLFERSSGTWAVYRAGAWEIGQSRAAAVIIGGNQVVGPRGAAIAPPAGGSTIDSAARAAIGAILSALQAHGLIGA